MVEFHRMNVIFNCNDISSSYIILGPVLHVHFSLAIDNHVRLFFCLLFLPNCVCKWFTVSIVLVDRITIGSPNSAERSQSVPGLSVLGPLLPVQFNSVMKKSRSAWLLWAKWESDSQSNHSVYRKSYLVSRIAKVTSLFIESPIWFPG